MSYWATLKNPRRDEVEPLGVRAAVQRLMQHPELRPDGDEDKRGPGAEAAEAAVQRAEDEVLWAAGLAAKRKATLVHALMVTTPAHVEKLVDRGCAPLLRELLLEGSELARERACFAVRNCLHSSVGFQRGGGWRLGRADISGLLVEHDVLGPLAAQLQSSDSRVVEEFLAGIRDACEAKSKTANIVRATAEGVPVRLLDFIEDDDVENPNLLLAAKKLLSAHFKGRRGPRTWISIPLEVRRARRAARAEREARWQRQWREYEARQAAAQAARQAQQAQAQQQAQHELQLP